MRKLLLSLVVLAAANANAGSSKKFTDSISGASIQVSDASGASLDASGNAVSASATFLADTSVAGWKLSKKIALRTARAVGNSIEFSGDVISDVATTSWDLSKRSGKASVKITVAASKEAKKLASKLGKASVRGVRASGKASVVVVQALVDVVGTIVVTPSVAAKALSEGRLADSSKVLLFLPSNIVLAAFGSEYHYETLIVE
ncbi:MAG: hypothetical protein KDD37_05050 [Bdellovibrionales bacterium]|nr:hypothetical protein [Bdellovibrionales bacterium]